MAEQTCSSLSGSLLAEVGEVRTGVAGAVLFLLAAGLRLVGTDTDTALLGYAVVVALAACSVGPKSALLLGVTAWALLTGFEVNSGGQLNLTQHGVAHVAVLAGVAVVSSLLASTVHAATRVALPGPVDQVTVNLRVTRSSPTRTIAHR